MQSLSWPTLVKWIIQFVDTGLTLKKDISEKCIKWNLEKGKENTSDMALALQTPIIRVNIGMIM
jgi:hypothetical protein